MHDERSSEEWNRAPDADESASRPASESAVSRRPDGAVAVAGLPAGDAGGAVAAAGLEPASSAGPAEVRTAAATEPGWVGGDRLGFRREIPAVAGGVLSAGVTASDGCSCQGRSGRSPVFAIGVLGYDFGTEARRDTFKSLMPSVYPAGYPYFGEPDVVPYPPNPYDPRQMVNYLAGYPRPRPPFPSSGGFPRLEPPAFPPEDPPVPDDYLGLEASPWDAAELTWTLNIELTPIYAIRPAGSFSPEAYRKLMEFLDGQTRNPHDVEFIERVSIPGYLSGETIRLFSGEVVPVLVPNVRGMFGWNTPRLIESVVGTVKEKVRSEARAAGRALEPDSDQLSRAEPEARKSLRSFLDRIYYDLRNLGRTPAERALNYSATNAFQAAFVFADPASKGMQLDTILVDRSPFCRKDSECMDVKLRFFDPENLQRARLVSRFTVDVSDVYPVLVGPIRTWSEVG